jgi:hypothetical protein
MSQPLTACSDLHDCTVKFSQKWEKLGDKKPLKLLIYEITSIRCEVLDGAPLSQFSVNERLRWKEGRVANRKEDGAYSLQGILDVELAPVYGEGVAALHLHLVIIKKSADQ